MPQDNSSVHTSVFSGLIRLDQAPPSKEAILQQPGARDAWNKLCRNGVPESELVDGLIATTACEHKELYEDEDWTKSFGIPQLNLKGFMEQLPSISARVKTLNDSKYLNPDRLIPGTEAAVLFKQLPQILSLYSKYLDHQVPRIRHAVNELDRIPTLFTAMQIKMVEFVVSKAGHPFYSELALLITAARCASGDPGIDAIDPDALKMLYNRSRDGRMIRILSFRVKHDVLSFDIGLEDSEPLTA